jgi:hypothetical protein
MANKNQTATNREDLHDSNPFVFEAEPSTESKSRQLELTPELVAKANTRAQELMLSVTKQPELHELANRMVDEGNVNDLLELISIIYPSETIKSDAQFMVGADSKELDRMLESRRSDRSKSKKAGLRQSANNTKTYIASMYAELMIRDVTGKPYTGSTSSLSLDVDDLKEDRDKLDRKIKSLQSKKSRLTKIAQYDAEAAKELEQVVADIDRLNQFRGVSKTSAKVIVKDAGLDNVRAALTDLQSDDSVDDATREKIMNLLKKIG